MEPIEDDRKPKVSKAAQMRAEALGYTNESNPFGDANLTQEFVWHKKEELDRELGRKGKREEEDMAVELERVKRIRQQRELERQKFEEEKLRQLREREAAKHKDWEKQEEEFHRQQARVRAQIRVRQGRAQPIDRIAMTLDETAPEADILTPAEVLETLSLEELEAFRRDMEVYVSLGQNLEFWEAIRLLLDDAIERREQAMAQQAAGHALAGGVHRALEADVQAMFARKTTAQLAKLQSDIQRKLASGAVQDTEYWEGLLRKARLAHARALTADVHAAALVRKREAQEREAQQRAARGGALLEAPVPAEPAGGDGDGSGADTGPYDDIYGGLSEAEAQKVLAPQPASRGPPPPNPALAQPFGRIPLPVEIRPETAAAMALAATLAGRAGARGDLLYRSEQDLLRQEASKPMRDGEEEFRSEVRRPRPVRVGARAADGEWVQFTPSTGRTYRWAADMKPRKPRYYNRVMTQYEWNKYNQAHYDKDHPPPKTTTGYKFNIFYPDLADPYQTPSYKISPHPTNPDLCIITFHASAPYEDLSFVIVNKEWERSDKAGFRCTFDRGVFRLYFNFRRMRYRR